jgi:hypothetical protein
MSSNRFVRASLVAVCAFAASCGESTAPVPPASVDELLGDISTTSAVAEPALAMGGGFAPAAAMPANASACPFNATTKFFVCANHTVNGLTFGVSYQLLDGSDTPLSQFNAATVASLRTVSDISGTLNQGSTNVTMQGHNDQKLSGLLTGTYTLNGTATNNATVAQTGQQTVTVNTTQTITNLVLPKRGTDEKYPKSGTIAMTTGVTGGTSATINITMTFDGTSIVKIAMTTAGVTTNCTMDMSKASPVPACGLP